VTHEEILQQVLIVSAARTVIPAGDHQQVEFLIRLNQPVYDLHLGGWSWRHVLSSSGVPLAVRAAPQRLDAQKTHVILAGGPGMAGEARKDRRPQKGVAPAAGDEAKTPEGGAIGTDRAARAGERRAETRDARRPGKPVPVPGGTPK